MKRRPTSVRTLTVWHSRALHLSQWRFYNSGAQSMRRRDELADAVLITQQTGQTRRIHRDAWACSRSMRLFVCC